eukprot:8485700-Pyramimonas_sp.AAC.1
MADIGELETAVRNLLVSDPNEFMPGDFQVDVAHFKIPLKTEIQVRPKDRLQCDICVAPAVLRTLLRLCRTCGVAEVLQCYVCVAPAVLPNSTRQGSWLLCISNNLYNKNHALVTDIGRGTVAELLAAPSG